MMPEPQDAILQVKELSIRFGGLKAVDGVSFELPRGLTLGIIGPNGAGKTTLFNMICGALKPTSGEVLLNGRAIQGLKPHEIARLGVARTFQISHPFRDMTVLDNVMMALGMRRYQGFGNLLGLCRTQERIAEAEALLDQVQLRDSSRKNAGDLSLGYLRRLEIARVLALKPVLLLLDEPCAGLGHDAAQELVHVIYRLKEQGTTIMLVEHNMAIAMNVCDRLVVLNYGTKIAEGLPSEIQTNPFVIEAYLGKDDEGA